MELGLRRFGQDLVEHRFRFRQAAGGVFAAVLFVVARPVWWPCVVGTVIAGLGGLIRLWAAGHVHKNEVLATDGPYAFVRHPQYLGNCLLAVGVSVAAGQPWAVAAWAVLFYLFYVPAVKREDEKLHRRFTERWESWYATTPAVFPTRWPAGKVNLKLREWSLGLCIRNGELLWLTLVTAGIVSIFLRLPG